MLNQFGRARAGLAYLLLACVAAVGLTACGGGSSSTPVAPERERINGVAVPPAPGAVANAATVADVDVDGNGIRDDIDRRIATVFGAEPPVFTIATAHARRLQAALVVPGTTSRQGSG